jgi:predicted  nucleic acid-binding Zn-ribbon protein
MPKEIIARCQSCGKESRVEWSLGTKCPACGSDKFLPVIHTKKSQRQGRTAAAPTATKIPVGAVLAVLLFAAAATALIFSVKKMQKPKEFREKVTMICTNDSCTNPHPDRLMRQELVTNNPFPKVQCRFCKQLTAYRAVQCRNCRTIFPLIQEGNKNPTIDLVCPECGSKDINFHSASIKVEQEQEEY